MIAKVHSAIPYGYTGRLVEVEGDTNRGLPGFNIVGMANKTIFEARERVRSAIANSGLIFPDQKVTINLAPAELTKDGSHLDIPIALNILALAGQILPSDLQDRLFVGELSLDGQAKPVRGIINIVETAVAAGFHEIYVPFENLPQASLVSNAHLFGITSLLDLILHLKDEKSLPSQAMKLPNSSRSLPQSPSIVKNTKTAENGPFLDDICGQTLAKRALSIAIAGRHNILLSGPPGAGKTMLARVAAELLPPPTPEEAIAITKIHSLHAFTDQIYHQRPFRAPHHTASSTSVIGGGPHASPGEISLAHHGILFLDELPEFPHNVLEALRQPLEDKIISVNRASQHTVYPANFMLIATMNPCPCGFYNDPHQPCTCSLHDIERYHKKISGPILDRIDLVINVDKVPIEDLAPTAHVKNTITDEKHPEHDHVKNTIAEATKRQYHRYGRLDTYNSSLTTQNLSRYVHISPSARKLLTTAANQLNLTARSYFKVVKVAQTIADLDSLTEVGPEQISEALSFRQQLF